MLTMTSELKGFYKLPLEERLRTLKEVAGLSAEDIKILQETGLGMDQAQKMIENVVGTFELPFGVAVNFLISGKDYVIPMVIEEPSVVAAASNAAKLARPGGGFSTSSTDPIMIGQIQLVNVDSPSSARLQILEQKQTILELANQQDPVLLRFGGGCKDIDVKVLDNGMVVTHLLVDCRDAMGANAVNTMAEAVAPLIEDITGGQVYLRIISNLATYRLARARATFKKEVIGPETVDGIVEAYEFARADPFRAATHNKGIMNGITAVVLATGNDTRAVEAGAHAYASLSGRYTSLTHWEKDGNGDLKGSIEIPMAVGLVGGATKSHPVAQVAVKILNVKTAPELGEIMAAVGLAQNFAALRALATEGIQRGHMKLHAKNIAQMAGAAGDLIEKVAGQMVKEGKVRADRAEEILKELTSS
ncbi:MAG: hydroxymethylglutaryl-CoA reductase, degradative [Theionarchaea archaeon]|nr:hydroxymethylglutaryl-CoA reductase, degradative [Theionarchaea archaeon]MBU7001521.1 hydroxymethylglutaryl-CoA reductase, degradative [Theionarchaea archaeon]MBU7019706.1 hydroxymethylglutaryl-CoA reductase, degradative [Theionarchaea archaeon]MBU7034417.1 hydroxymethylglutaryl-CoA reductase, degradative [Theionarchaea archaeon]